jgi:NADH-quinone oxidoreductase subunit J
MSEILWWVFASLAVLGGIGTVTSRSPISSLLFLMLAFFNLAALYVLMDAHFIAAIQVIVYAGAILVLFMFVIMLLNLGHDYRPDVRGGAWIVLGSIAAGLVGWGLTRVFVEPDAVADLGGGEVIDASLRELNAVGAIAQPLFRDFMVPFEVTSVLLLAAIVGAVILAKRKV